MNDINELIKQIESHGYQWDVGHIGKDMYEARIWRWPHTVAKVRSTTDKPALELLHNAYTSALIVEGKETIITASELIS